MAKAEPAALKARRLESDIVRVRLEQVTLQLQLEEAVAAEIRGLTLIDGARAVQARCRSMIEQHAQTISRLQDEIAELIPRQRPGG